MAAIEERHEKKSWLSSGTMIALVSALAYSATFLYEQGYATFFNIPEGLIELSLTQVFVAFSGLAFAAVIVYMLTRIALNLLSTFRHDSLIRLIAFQVPWLGFWLLIGFLLGSLKAWIVVGVLCLYSLFDDFAYPLIIHRGPGTYREKLAAQERLDAQRPSVTKMLLGATENSRQVSFLRPIILCVFLCFPAGRYTARCRAYFYVLSEDPDVVVLRIYNDKVICAPFDREAKEINRELTIRTLSEQGQLKLAYEKIGPLKVSKDQEELKEETRGE